MPPFLDDMRPQGFLGRRFTERNLDLALPPRLQDWSVDHILRAVCLRGEDTVGDLVLGDGSFDRWLALSPRETKPSDFPARADAAAHGEVGSSAGGEHPKFTAWSAGRHVLVKFANREDGGAVTRRWRDLLACEALALRVVREAKLPAPRARCFDVDGWRFLEVERFDRVGARGRRGVISLGAWSNEHLGHHLNWTSAAKELLARGELTDSDARAVRWLDVFGELIANSDRHFWNVSFFWEPGGRPTLAPAYDMLPMLFAPGISGLTEREFQPTAPTAATLDVWPDAARSAAKFWKLACEDAAVSPLFRKIATKCLKTLEARRAELLHLER